MQPTLVSGPIRHEGWVYEEKYDGGHMLAYKDGDRVQISQSGVGLMITPSSMSSPSMGDTSGMQGTGTYGSRSAAIGASALVRSSEKIREKVTRLAAHQLPQIG